MQSWRNEIYRLGSERETDNRNLDHSNSIIVPCYKVFSAVISCVRMCCQFLQVHPVYLECECLRDAMGIQGFSAKAVLRGMAYI